MKIGIMGGTFDPVHNGHLMLGHAAYEAFSLDQIWFMPNGNPPHKKSETIKSTAEEEMNRQIQYLSEKYHAKIRLLETPLMPVSSHELRASLQSGDSVSEYMPAAVCSYIKQHHLYR